MKGETSRKTTDARGEDKGARILEAALAEFAAAGYEGASTNRIVQAAGISKGLLFHYYGSKPQLYLAVLDDVIERLTPLVLEGYKWKSSDIFDCILDGGLHKLEVAQHYPREYRFLYQSWLQTPADVQTPFQERLSRLQSMATAGMTSGFEAERLRPGVTATHAMTLLVCFMEGFTSRWITRLQGVEAEEALQSITAMREEATSCLSILKQAIYKETEAPLDSGM